MEQEFQTRGPGSGSAQGTQATDRAAQLLALVLDSSEPLGVNDLAAAAHLPKSTTSRLLGSLERHGLVHRAGARGKVAAGPAILRFAHRGAVDGNLIALAREGLQALATASGETVNLAVPGAGAVEHLAQIDCSHFLGTGQWVGRQVDYHATAVGKVLLAHGAAELPAGALRRATEATIVDRRRLEDDLARCRRDGYALAVDELEPGLAAMAAPVHGPTGDVIAALSITGPALRLSPRRLSELAPVLIDEARSLSARLGHREKGDQAA